MRSIEQIEEIEKIVENNMGTPWNKGMKGGTK